MYKIIGADQRQYGPVSADQIRAWIREGRLNAQSSVKSEGTESWPAMELSRKVVSHHWWVLFGLAIVLALVNLLGTLALCVGVFITTPVTFAAMAYAYEDIFGPRPPKTA